MSWKDVWVVYLWRSYIVGRFSYTNFQVAPTTRCSNSFFESIAWKFYIVKFHSSEARIAAGGPAGVLDPHSSYEGLEIKPFETVGINPNLGGGGVVILPPCWFSLNNSETVKAVTMTFAAFNNISLGSFVPTFVSLTCPSLQILSKTQTRVFPISGFLVNAL